MIDRSYLQPAILRMETFWDKWQPLLRLTVYSSRKSTVWCTSHIELDVWCIRPLPTKTHRNKIIISVSEGLEMTLQILPGNKGPCSSPAEKRIEGCTVLLEKQRGQGMIKCVAKAERVVGEGRSTWARLEGIGGAKRRDDSHFPGWDGPRCEADHEQNVLLLWITQTEKVVSLAKAFGYEGLDCGQPWKSVWRTGTIWPMGNHWRFWGLSCYDDGNLSAIRLRNRMNEQMDVNEWERTNLR